MSELESRWFSTFLLIFCFTFIFILSTLGYAPRAPIILVGTKIDLRNDRLTLEQLAEKDQRPLTPSQGEYLAKMCSAKAYLECSSILNFNIRNVFERSIEVFEEHQQRSRHGRRILSEKIHSCSWFDSLFCCTNANGSRRQKSSRGKKTKGERYAR